MGGTLMSCEAATLEMDLVDKSLDLLLRLFWVSSGMDANSDGIFLTLLCDLHTAVCTVHEVKQDLE